MKLYELSVKKPVAVVMAVLMFVVIGLYSLTMIPMEMTPKMDLSMAIVMTQYPNVGSEEVENMVTKPIESAISSVSGVSSINSQTSQGISMVLVQFSTGTDMDKAVSDMESNINLVKSMLPDTSYDPIVVKLDTDMMSTAQFSVAYEGYDIVQTKKFVDDVLENKLKAINGVASVSVTGARDREIDVFVNPSLLYGYDMTIQDIANAIMAQNQNMPSGTTTTLGKKLSSRMLGKVKSVDEIKTIPLMTKSGQVINIKDIATVEDTYSEITSIARLNSNDAISVTISKESDANTVNVVKEIYEVLDTIKKDNPKFTYNMTMEQGTMIEDSVNSVAQNALTGAVLAIIILLLFLGSLRTSLVIGISMPVSVVTTFIGMYFSGMSLNVVSLGGLALGVGMLVDNSVVLIENIFRHRNNGKGEIESSITGSKEVVGAIIASVLTTCIVYVPILFIDNMMAVMFKQLGFAIIFSQIASLLTTFLLIPMLSSRIKLDNNDKPSFFKDKILTPFDNFMKKAYAFYEKSLNKLLGKRKRFILIIVALFILSLFIIGNIGMELIPEVDSGVVSVKVSLPSGAKLDDTQKLVTDIESVIHTNKNVKDIFSIIGSSGGAESMLGGASEENSASLTVVLKDEDKRNDDANDVVNQIRKSLNSVTGAQIEVSTQSMAMMSSSNELEFQFSSNDDEALEKYVLDAQKILAGVEGVSETSNSISETKYELHIKPNRLKLMNYGLTPVSCANLVNSIMTGVNASTYTENGSEYDIKVKYKDNYKDTLEKLKTIRIKTPMGMWVSLSDIASISVEEGYSTLTRVDQRRVISISASLYGTDMKTATDDFEKKLKDLPAPDGIMRENAGTFEIMIDAISQLILAILLGILLMYMIMAAQFGNLLQPLIILVTIPLSLIGVCLSLLLTNSRLSAVSCVGILMLVGIIVNNAIVLIEFINQLREERPNDNRNSLVVEAGIVRMRPILMTSLTSILGFLPMALTRSGGGSMMSPLAIVLLGGLLVGTFLTLYVIPVVYTIVDDKAQKRKIKKARKEQENA